MELALLGFDTDFDLICAEEDRLSSRLSARLLTGRFDFEAGWTALEESEVFVRVTFCVEEAVTCRFFGLLLLSRGVRSIMVWSSGPRGEGGEGGARSDRRSEDKCGFLRFDSYCWCGGWLLKFEEGKN